MPVIKWFGLIVGAKMRIPQCFLSQQAYSQFTIFNSQTEKVFAGVFLSVKELRMVN